MRTYLKGREVSVWIALVIGWWALWFVALAVASVPAQRNVIDLVFLSSGACAIVARVVIYVNRFRDGIARFTAS